MEKRFCRCDASPRTPRTRRGWRLSALAAAAFAASSSAMADCRGGMPHLGTSPMCTKDAVVPRDRDAEREAHRQEMEDYRRSERARELNRRGISAFGSGDYLAAYSFFAEANGTYPNATYLANMKIARDAEASRLNELGRRAYERRDYDGAILFFEQAAEIDPDYRNNILTARWAQSIAHNERGTAAYARGDFAAALSAFEQAERSYSHETYRGNITLARNALNIRAYEEAQQRRLAREEREVRNVIAGVDAALARRARPAAERDGPSFVKPYGAGTEGEEAAARTATVRADRTSHASQIQRLMNEIGNIKVPSPVPEHVHEGVILGLNDPLGNVAAKYGAITSPWSGQPIDIRNVHATTDSDKFFPEFVRGLRDNLTVGQYSLNTATGEALVKQLAGKKFDRLIAHSNGATVAEALIRRGVIHVEELNVIGGDRSWTNLGGLQELINTGLVKRVIVWTNPGDLIPAGSAVPQILKFGPTFQARHFLKLMPGVREGSETVQVRFLAGDQYLEKSQEIHVDHRRFDAHDLKNMYLNNIAIYFGVKTRH